VGLISDTHNHFDPRIPVLFDGVAHILHAGDIGLPWVILELEQIAPVTAVSGNNDYDSQFRETESLELAGRRILVHHIVDPYRLTPKLEHRIQREGPHIVVFGHSHRTFCERRGSTLFVNPGYAGKTRFGLQRSVAILDCALEEVEFREL
jgi:putative phosphoesterase